MFLTYSANLRNRAYLCTDLPVSRGEMTSLPVSNYAASQRVMLAAISSHELSPMVCQGELENHGYSCPAAT